MTRMSSITISARRPLRRAGIVITAAVLCLTPAVPASAGTGPGPHPAFLVTYQGTRRDPVNLHGALLWFRLWAYDKSHDWAPGVKRNHHFPGTIYRLPSWNSRRHPSERVSVRRIRGHLWGAYEHSGRRLIVRFRSG